jgi:hypothetical protein
MKQPYALLSFILALALIYYSFSSLMPRAGTSPTTSETEFSTERALIPLREITKAPHYYGSQDHSRVRDFLVNELKGLGFETEIQEGYVLNPEVRNMDKPKNIIGRIKGSGSGKSLLLLSHYDSALVPSFGASDAGSGVVTILESLRAYLALNKAPINDIIVLFTDCEEIGLDGAKLFVNEHAWASNIGLALNFEARGSGGPSNMILETNGGNSNLIKAFIEANPEYPVTSSLMYSIYKMLPNNTDSTIFREDGDIDSFFFAFIDDHFDYHTANDNIENLDLETLQHQGSYLLPLLTYFADADLSQLKSEEDNVYVNFPFLKMISYPFSWILAMIIIAITFFIGLVIYGINRRKLSLKGIGKGFVPFLGALIISGLIGYFGWVLLLKVYPQYEEVQHGFKYNGHIYVGFFVFLTLALLFNIYNKYAKNVTVANLFIAPLVFWFLINVAVYVYLKGAAYFIIPVFFGLLALWLLIRQEKPNLLLMVLIAAPAIFLYAPLIQFFPIGLGSDHVFISCVFTVLLLGLLLPIFGFYKKHHLLSLISAAVALVFFISAHLKSDFSETRQKPNSLVYYQNTDTRKSYWVTYDKILDDWTKGYLGDSPEVASKYELSAPDSKYKTSYTFASEAPQKNIPLFETILKKDTVIDNFRNITFSIIPKRNINQIELFADTNILFHSLSFNGMSVPKDSSGNVYSNRRSNKLLRFYIAENDSLEVSYSIKKDTEVSFTVVEYSFDLLSNSQFTMNQRPKNTMPKPFIVTDAIAIQKLITINSLQVKKQDSITETPNPNSK